MRQSLPFGLSLLMLALAACRSGPPRNPAIGEAYAGPATLPLRKDIPLQSPVVATVKHGERLEIIQHRRRFLKVRTAKGTEGWIEDHLLLSTEEIATLKEVERRALTLPSQGVASTYDMLNVHTEPNRLSPSFLQVKEGEKVDVVAHLSTPRTQPERKSLVPPRPKAIPPARKHAEGKYPLPPMPHAPPPPKNWLELSRTPPEVQQAIADSKAPPQPMPMDDWSLIRNAKGESGWVLTRRLYMAIPDEVAQYAEGHRITSYFAMGEVQDGDQLKRTWLWTTITGADHPYDFDSFRVFTWSLRRHRYETAFIQRKVEGYFPVLRQGSGFSVCLDTSSGRVRRNYSFIVTTVRLASQQPCEPASNLLAAVMAGKPVPQAAGSSPAAEDRSLMTRLKALAKKWFNRYRL